MPLPLLGAQTGYRPRSARNQLKDLVEDCLEELFQVYDERFRDTYGPLHRRVRVVLESFLRCGDLHFGFLRLLCPRCGENRLVPYACRGRGLCPSCGQKRSLAWAERMVEEVLPIVLYRQLVFTIPRNLRKAFLFDRSLYGDLCRIAYASTRDFLRLEAAGRFPKLARAVPAMVVSPQSFGDLIVPHAHGHAIVSLGLFRHDGVFLPMEEVDFSGLEEIFRERFFRMMLRREKVRPETVERMRAWEHSGFAVNSERKIEAYDRKGLEGLLSYMERAPVSLRRLTYRQDEGLVHYQGTRFHPRLGRDHQLLPAMDFLASLVPHIALRYEVTVRSYGALSTTFRRKAGWIQKPPVQEPPLRAKPLPDFDAPEAERPSVSMDPPSPPLPATTAPTLLPPRDEEGEFARKKRRNWARLIARTWLCDPELCPSCGERMRVVAAISSPTQDDVIEKILKSRGEWDPPWKRLRKIRGPPSPGTPGGTPGSQSSRPSQPAEENWIEGADPPHPDLDIDPPFEDGGDG
ncbi:MAG: transposase zinc-binding domain-containing protein [Thermoanaerobaculia bacterium]